MRVRIAARTFGELPNVTGDHVVGYGHPIAAPEGTEGYVTSVGPAIRSAATPDELLSVVEFVVNFTTTHADQAATERFAAWLWDGLQAARGDGPRRLTIADEAVDPDDRGAVVLAVSDHLYGVQAATP